MPRSAFPDGKRKRSTSSAVLDAEAVTLAEGGSSDREIPQGSAGPPQVSPSAKLRAEGNRSFKWATSNYVDVRPQEIISELEKAISKYEQVR